MGRLYKVRRFQNGRNAKGEPFMNYSLTIPTAIAEALPDEMRFSCELTEDGLLFRPGTGQETSVELPEWAKNGQK